MRECEHCLNIGFLSRSDLSSFVMSLFQYGQGVSWGGQSMFRFLCGVFAFGLVWFSIRGRCRQLSLIENHTQVAWDSLLSCGCLFPCECLLPHGTVSVSFVSRLLFCSVQFMSVNKRYGHLPRCALVLQSFSLLLLRRGGRMPLQDYWVQHPVYENGLLLQTESHVAVACYIKQADRHQGIQLLFD